MLREVHHHALAETEDHPGDQSGGERSRQIAEGR